MEEHLKQPTAHWRAPLLSALMAAVVLVVVPVRDAHAQATTLGTWRNPQDSVHVRAETCEGRICGVVVWASEKAKADARKGGTNSLVGAQLFRDFIQQSDREWRGKVYIPDLRQTFTGTVTIVDQDTIKAQGCLFGRIGCKSQLWKRVSE